MRNPMPTPSHIWRRPFLAGLLALLIVVPTGWSADPPLAETLKEVLNRGATIYNDGDRNGCYRLFEGALLALKPHLAGQAEVLQIVENGLRDVEQHRSVGE